jgi:hypothetical protein
MRKRIPLKPRIRIEDITIECRSISNPEEYEALLNGKQIGYLRLQDGHFTVKYGVSSGTLVWESFPEGNNEFTAQERPLYLKIAKQKLFDYNNKQPRNGTETNA